MRTKQLRKRNKKKRSPSRRICQYKCVKRHGRVINSNPKYFQTHSKGSGEKENKSAVLNKNSTAPTTKVNSAKTGKSSAPAQNGQQTNRNNTNERAPREG